VLCFDVTVTESKERMRLLLRLLRWSHVIVISAKSY